MYMYIYIYIYIYTYIHTYIYVCVYIYIYTSAAAITLHTLAIQIRAGGGLSLWASRPGRLPPLSILLSSDTQCGFGLHNSPAAKCQRERVGERERERASDHSNLGESRERVRVWMRARRGRAVGSGAIRAVEQHGVLSCTHACGESVFN